MIPFLNRTRIESQNGNNQDIINTMIKYVPEATNQVSIIKKRFQGKSNLNTAQKIWGFLKYYVTYKKDASGQEIKLPSALIHFKNGDCKSYSLFAAAILKGLGLPAYFRFACYDNTKIPSHVYVYTVDEKGKQIIIDACYTKFNAEKRFTFNKDYKL